MFLFCFQFVILMVSREIRGEGNCGDKKRFDYLVVGSGLYGAIFAHSAGKAGRKVLVVEKRHHIGGNVFHTNSRRVWEFVTKFAKYTEKQWGRLCKDLPVSIIKRIPVRLTFDNNYFEALYQGIPVGGYTRLVERLLEGIEVRVGVDYLQNKDDLDALADKVIFTGTIDSYFKYQLGELEYRSVRFESEVLDKPNFQGCAQVNYVDLETPWTRTQPKTVIIREYSTKWKVGIEPYHPVNDERNNRLYEAYRSLAENQSKVLFGGRLGEYKYYDMDKVV